MKRLIGRSVVIISLSLSLSLSPSLSNRSSSGSRSSNGSSSSSSKGGLSRSDNILKILFLVVIAVIKNSSKNGGRSYLKVVIVYAWHILRRSDLSYMTHYSPLFWGKVTMEKMPIFSAFGPVLKNGRCVGYIRFDHN